jgi:hypothetical protein
VRLGDLPRNVHVLEEVVMRWLPRLRLVFARRPWLYWAIAGTLTACAWWQVSALHADARRARDSWGATVTVWVSLADTPPGTPLSVERRAYPARVVPDGALVDTDPPHVAARRVAAGAVLVPADVADGGALPASWVVFTVPSDGTPALEQDDDIAVFSVGRRLCDGTVAAPPAEQVEFGVPPDCATAVASGLALGDVVLARRA